MMKNIITILLAMALTGCVSNYYPLPESSYGTSEDVYYEDDELIEDIYYDESYAGRPARVMTTTYVDTTYYPWYSMDYFYLGAHHYRPSYFGSYYRSYYGSPISIGISFGYPYYSPFDYPRYYAGWYAPRYYYGGYYGWRGYYSYNPYWRHGYNYHTAYRGHHNRGYGGRGYGGSGSQRGYDDNGRAAYADDRSYNDNRRGRGNERRGQQYSEREVRPGARSASQRTEIANSNRNISVAPGSNGTDKGMVVVNKSGAKVRQSRPEPVNRSSLTGSVESRDRPGIRRNASSASRTTAPAKSKVRQTRTGETTRSNRRIPSNTSDQQRAVRQPSRSSASRASVGRVSQSQRTTTVRSRGTDKSRATSKTTPVQSRTSRSVNKTRSATRVVAPAPAAPRASTARKATPRVSAPRQVSAKPVSRPSSPSVSKGRRASAQSNTQPSGSQKSTRSTSGKKGRRHGN